MKKYFYIQKWFEWFEENFMVLRSSIFTSSLDSDLLKFEFFPTRPVD